VLGRVNPQGSLLETRHARRHLVTKGSFYERLADNGDAFLCDDDYAHLYAPTMGRPSIPPSIMVRAMLLATYERVRSDAEIARNTRVDLDWKAAMGVDDDFGGIAPTTFSLMRARMVAADADAKLFEKTLEKAVAAGIFGNQKLTAIVDSSPRARSRSGLRHLRAHPGVPAPGGQGRRRPPERGNVCGHRWVPGGKARHRLAGPPGPQAASG